MYIHMWSASSSESMALLVLSDAESDSDCPKDPLVFGREPANLKPRSRAGLTGPRGPHKPVRSFASFRFQAARRPNAAPGPARTGPPPHRLRRVTQQLRAAPCRQRSRSSISACLPRWQPRPPLRAPPGAGPPVSPTGAERGQRGNIPSQQGNIPHV